MKTITKLKTTLIILVIMQIVVGLICGAIVAISIPYFINKMIPISDGLFLFLVIFIFIIFIGVFFMFIIYPSITNKNNKFTKMLNRHSISISFFIIMLMIILVSIYNKKEFDIDRITNLLNIEWIIFGVTVAFFTVWNALFLSKYENIEENPNDEIGIKRLQLIGNINQKKIHFTSMLYSILMLIINVLLLISFTSLFLVNNSDNEIVNILSLISFYFSTNTMITIFVECIIPMIDMKIDFDIRIEKYDLNDGPKMILMSAIEEAAYEIKKNNLTNEDKDKVNDLLDKFKCELIKIRSESEVEKEKQEEKTKQESESSENESNNEGSSEAKKQNDISNK